jgi:cell division protein FtsZ
MVGFVQMADSRAEYSRKKSARILVFGIGGAGGNAVDRMIEEDLGGVEFIAVNTDEQAIDRSLAPVKFVIGEKLFDGLGVGGDPEKGKQAANDDKERLTEIIRGADMVFLTGGMGGGTGTGALPVIAEIAKKADALTIAVVTKPFMFEGNRRMDNANKGLKDLKEHVDTLIEIPNQRLLSVVGPDTGFLEAFSIADEVLHHGVRIISDLITIPGIINLDIMDVRSVLGNVGGDALIGRGEASGEGRALKAAEMAIKNRMLDDVSISGAKGVLVNISGSKEMPLYDITEAASYISKAAGQEANFIFGTAIDDTLGDNIRVGVIAAGFQRASNCININTNAQTGETIPQIRRRTQEIGDFVEMFTNSNVVIPHIEPAAPPKPVSAEDYIVRPSQTQDKRYDQEEKPAREVVPVSSGYDPADYEIPAFLRKTQQG